MDPTQGQGDSTLNSGQPSAPATPAPAGDGQGKGEEGTPQTPSQPSQPKPSGEAASAQPSSQPAQTKPAEGGNNQPPSGYVPQRQFNRAQEALRKTRAQLARERQARTSQNAAGQGQGGQPSGQGNEEYVRNLELKVAENDLRTGARKILKNYPQLPKSVRSAILHNPRGFVNPETEDVETGLMDIEDYIESIAGEFGDPEAGATPQGQQVPGQKQVKIAGTNNQDSSQGGSTPAEVASIMARPPDTWTAEDKAKLEAAGAPKL